MSDDIEQALDNLSAIKQGKNPTEPTSDPDPEPQGALELAEQEVDRLFEKHDLAHYISRSQIHVGVARWSGRHGVCKYRRKLPKKRFGERMSKLPTAVDNHAIVINEKVFEQSGAEEYLDVVRHELAHAITYAKHGSSQGHNSKWKQIARKLGADPKSTHHRRDRSDEYEYWIGCPNCGMTSGRTKRSKVIQKPFRRKCKECGHTPLSSFNDGKELPDGGGVVDVDSIKWDNREEWIGEGAP